MKYFSVIIILCVLGLSAVQAQKGQERRADYKVIEQNYEEAAEMYKAVLKHADSETALRVNHKMARMYYLDRKYRVSINYYNAVLNTGNTKILSVDEACNILTILNRMDSTDAADKWAESFAKNDSMMMNQRFRNLQRSILGIEIPIPNDTLLYTISPVPFNTPYSEFWTGEVNDSTILFIRSDAGDKNDSRTMFQGSRFYTYNKSTERVSPYKSFPLVFQAGPATFFKGNKAMIYTDNNMKSQATAARRAVSTVGQRNLQLIKAVYNEKTGSWKSQKSIFRSDDPNISYCHPALANNDKTLFFSSNMPGGFGGADIYKCDWDSVTNSWGKPVNLGATVNTAGDEVYPLVKNKILYFSSNGHIGLGGFDIYGANLNASFDVDDSTLVYLPEPINSKFNDYSLFLNSDQKSGFFTSDRNGGKGIDDIYSFNVTSKKKPVIEELDTTSAEPSNVDIGRTIISDVELSNVYFDFDKINIKQQYISVMNEALTEIQDPKNAKESYLILGSADPRGTSSYNKRLSEKRANEVKTWLVNHGVDASRLIAKGRGSIPMTDHEIKEALGLPDNFSNYNDKATVKKAYHEARRVVIKPIKHK